MSRFLTSSIGKKFLMSISGFFLVTFLTVHLTANIFVLVGSEIYNEVSHFMDDNAIIQIMQPILAFGFLLHILYSLIIQFKNWRSRPVKYNKQDQKDESKWSSRNMIWLGIFVFAFLVTHLMNYFIKMKFTGSPFLGGEGDEENNYELVTSIFSVDIVGIWAYIYSAVYIIGFMALALHINHGFWSAFQTLGLSNNKWRKRLDVLGSLFALLIFCGFTIIPLYFLFIK
jgi:succinate dehydrogenase / fumarate reductase, cytochrome b subunit